jgi:uncharacterized protein YndB with AHSA1/START domain
MTVTSVQKDDEEGTMTISAEFTADLKRVWRLWEDPRQLERWWGPPTYPATFVDHDMSPGGRVSYFMTGPEGDQPHGWWRVLSVDAPYSLTFEDGFADDGGTPDPEMPVVTIGVTLTVLPAGGTLMVVTTSFPTTEAMDRILAMGMEEGMAAALSQIDAIL